MKEEIESGIRDLWYNHRSSSLGVILGIVFSVLVLVFGFWNMIFVALCAGLGFYIGKKLDNGENVVGKFYDYMKDNWKRG